MNPNVKVAGAVQTTPENLRSAVDAMELVSRHGIGGALRGLTLAALASHDAGEEFAFVSRGLVDLEREHRRRFSGTKRAAPADVPADEEMELTEKPPERSDE